MKLKFDHVVSPVSNLALSVYVFGAVYLLFLPSWKQLGALFLVDFTAFVIFASIERFIFVRVHPQYRDVLPVLNLDHFRSKAPEERLKVLQAVYQFPWVRAAYFFVISFFKVTPGAAVVLFFFDYESVSETVLKVMLFEIVILVGFASLAYFELHAVVSSHLKQAFGYLQGSPEFFAVNPRDSVNRFLNVESLSHLLLFALTLFLVGVLVLSPMGEHFGWRVIALWVVSGLLHARIYWTSKKLLISGTQDVMNQISEYDFTGPPPLLVLHTSSEINSIQRLLNRVSMKLIESQEELSSWMRFESDQSRFRTLGEVAGLVVHDLSSPLHVVKYCVDLFKTDPEKAIQPLNSERMSRSLEKAVNLVQSLRAYLKEGKRGQSSISFSEANTYVLQVLGLEFQSKLPEQLEALIRVDPQVQSLQFRCYRIDLIQILDNLYRNSLENMVATGASSPSIHVGLRSLSNERAEIAFQDTGSGLSSEDFERMTSGRIDSGGFRDREAALGLGLRLTRRLVERLGGSLRIVPAEVGFSGTCMVLSLPIYQEVDPGDRAEP